MQKKNISEGYFDSSKEIKIIFRKEFGFFSRKSSFGGGPLPLRALSSFPHLILDRECLSIWRVSLFAQVYQTLDPPICLWISFLSSNVPILAILGEEMCFPEVGKVWF